MVKRAKSPEIPETDKYFTVYKPYPPNADFEVKDDYIACARWIATVIGPNPLHGMWWKPSARGMILLEVDKQYPYNERVLGEHRWDEFLKKPSPDETGRASQIFHSFYAKGRDAQKDGWKRIHVESFWFQGWHPSGIMRLPYPETHWCPVPKEDQTNKSLCRPLPVKDKAPPPKTAPPIVGSSAWAQAKAKAPTTQRVLQGAWEQRKKDAQAQAAGVKPENRGAWNKPIIANPPAPAGAWGKPPLMTPAINSATGGLRNNKPQDYPVPPGLAKLATGSTNTSVNTSSGSSGLSGSSSGGTTDWTSMEEGLPELDGLQEQFKTISLSQSQQAVLDGVDPYDDDLEPEDHEILQPWEREEEDLDDPMATGIFISRDDKDLGPMVEDVFDVREDANVVNPNAYNPSYGEGAGGGVGGYEGDWADAAPQPLPASIAPCPHHPGRNCKKGICQWRAEQERKEAREKREREKREKDKQKRVDKSQARRAGGKDRESDGARYETESVVSATTVTADGDGFAPVTRGRGKGGRGWGRARGRGW